MTGRSLDETRITGRMPNLDIEVTHRRFPERDAEQITISLVATPSFEAFARVLEAGNPLLAWTAMNPFATAWLRMMQAAWTPWLGAAAPALLTKPRDD